MSNGTNSTGSPQRISFRLCTEVSPVCPVEATVLGYYPNLGVNAFLAAAFGACIIGLATTGIWKRTWGYSLALTAGCILEFAGYISRILLHTNPWNSSAFQTQICAIILAPTLICISIYLTLKHITLSLSPSLSRLRPRLYPLIFVPADVSCLILQAIGGSLAASAGYTRPELLISGDRVIIAGIALQCAVLGGFGVMVVDYYLRVKKWVRGMHGVESAVLGDSDRRALATWRDGRFRAFVYAVAGAYVGILVRCIYRIAEMAGGWGNPIMQDEPSFVVLEGFCIVIPVILLTAFPPGFLFPDMAEREAQRFRRTAKSEKPEEPVISGDEGTLVERKTVPEEVSSV
ncbi:RTA1-domain-containing protein [Annulohypoxylon maeteangense]|uniref:RTA1-domain-containing protein n=1 Tax=Annulohypoxylon maeteangense TaxID=1927788 RepID=UPI002007A2DF|nr:RTA1-domain-containing protein [Annulohypoxylon maeteangense]KAI0890261.1 RTA1-domain-containing protein [Annulohypoxylon maeteangense]